METIIINRENPWVELTLSRSSANAINAFMLQELIEAFQEFSTDDKVRGVIITGNDNFFSAGLDVVEIYHYNKDELNNLWESFMTLTNTMTSFSKPLIAAISGHSPAGGCVLALTADYRIMSSGSFKIGLNEIPVGIIVPESIYNLYAYWLGRKNAYNAILDGKLFDPEEAKKIGLIDEIASPKKIMDIARTKMSTYISFNENAWRKSKLNCRSVLIKNSETTFEKNTTDFINQWWSPKARDILSKLISKIKKK